ncbi:MAG: hypothetical protein RSB67_02655 [Clostridia bacterium]
MKKEEEIFFYECPNPKCGYIIKVSKNVLEEDKNTLEELENNIECPKCGKKGFKKLSKEKIKEIKEKENKKVEENNLKKRQDLHDKKVDVAKDVVKYIVKERKNLFEDLKTKLLSDQISPQRFISLFYNISCDIMTSRKKEYLPDFAGERKTILAMGHDVLDLYNIKEDQEEIIDSYDIQKDEIYEVYHQKYIEGDNTTYNEYIGETRLNNYMKKLEEKNMAKQESRCSNSSKKYQKNLELNFKKSLNDGIKKIK